MRTFEVFTSKTGPPVAVKRGFCWPGIFFPIIWPYVIGLKPLFWTVAILSPLFAQFARYGIGPAIKLGDDSLNIITLTYFVLQSLALGFFGNGLLASSVREGGDLQSRTVRARSPKEAVASLEPPAESAPGPS